MILSKIFLPKHQNKAILVLKLMSSRTWTTLKSSAVIFQALETSPASLISASSAISLASTTSKAQFPQKNLPGFDGLIITGTNLNITGNFCGMDHKNLIFY